MAVQSRRHRWMDGCFAARWASIVLSVTTMVGCGGENPGAITVDPDSGDLYIADSGQRRVLAVRKGDGQPSALIALTDLRGPTGLAFDPASKVLFVADGGRVLRVGVDGTPPVVVAGIGEEGYGGDGGPATAARLGGRLGLAFDVTRRVLYIADTANHRVRCVNAAGVIRTVAGNGDEARIPLPRGPARELTVPFPREVAVDGDGNVYVLADAYVSIPRVVQMIATPQC